MHAQLCIGSPLGWPLPHFIVEFWRHRHVRSLRAIDIIAVGHSDADRSDFTQRPAPHHLGHLVQMFQRPHLTIHAKDTSILLHRFDDPLPFGNRAGNRLLQCHVFTGVSCFDCHGRMPMVGRGDHDRVDVLSRQQVAIIAAHHTTLILPGCFTIGVSFFNQLFCMIQSPGIDVTQGNDLSVGHL